MNRAMSHLANKLVLQGIHITGFWNKEVISQKEKKKKVHWRKVKVQVKQLLID